MGLELLVGVQNTENSTVVGEYLENPGVVGVGVDGSKGGHGGSN